VCGPRLQFLHAIDLLVHPFQRPGKHLFAMQRVLGRAGETPTSRLALSADFTPLLSRQRTLPIAQIAKTLAQRLQIFESNVVNSRVVTLENDFMLVVTENTALEFARNCHAVSSRLLFKMSRGSR
jgi:hypothetical protein